MRDQLNNRLQTLKTEYEAGQKMLADLEAKQINLRETLLRISGAIQVLEEMLTDDEANGNQPLNTVETISTESGVTSEH